MKTTEETNTAALSPTIERLPQGHSDHGNRSLVNTSPQKLIRNWSWRHRGSLLFIALPTLISALYFFVFAADLFASEARFVVRSPSHSQIGGVAGLLQIGGINRAQDDVYAVQDFVTSRDALSEIGKQIDLRAIYSRPEADFAARFPNLWDHDDSEDFFRYFERRVQVVFDTTTGITTLVVKAFRPEDAQAVANQLLDAGEKLINRLNARSLENSVHYAEAEVQIAQTHVSEAEENILAYRNRESLLDPGKNSGAIFDTYSKMEADLATTRTRLAEIRRNSPDSPQRPDLETHAAALERQIQTQRSRMVGGGGALAPVISEYDQLTLRQEFADKELSSALAALETARAEARRQQIYLDRVVSADLPDKALYPRRVSSVLVVFISCFLIYSIGKLLIVGVREHAQV